MPPCNHCARIAACDTCPQAAENLLRDAQPHNTSRLSLTISDGADQSFADHEKHVWARQLLPVGWASTFNGGTLVVRWKDQGWGNRKGHIWGRVGGRGGQGGQGSGEWHRLSSNVAPHAWATASFPLPAGWFNGAAGASLLELALEVGGGGGHSLHIHPGAELSLEPRRLPAARPR